MLTKIKRKGVPKRYVINAKGHLLGRLASVVAKTLLNGDKVVVVGCEQLIISGRMERARLKYFSFLRKRCNVNPARGPFHHRAPRDIFKRTVRGMLPYQRPRGAKAFRQLKTFEGIPAPYYKLKLKCVPRALKIVNLPPGRKFCHLGNISYQMGWRYNTVVHALETRRKIISHLKKQHKKRLNKITEEATKKTEKVLEKDNAFIRAMGYEVYSK